MKDTKTQEKTFENLNDFWQEQFEEPLSDEQFLTKLKEAEMSEARETVAESNGDKWLKILKRFFLFLPGALFLFLFSYLIFSLFFLDEIGAGLLNFVPAVPWLMLTGFMVMFGIGDFKKPKHLLIPLSVVAFSFIAFLISLPFAGSIDGSMSFLKYCAFLLFPLILVIPVLTRDFLDTAEETI